MDQQRFNVIIVGGGPVGLSLALALSGGLPGIAVALVDRRAIAVPRDARASAIAAGVRRIFEGLGVWDRLLATAEPVLAMRITDSGAGDIARPLLLNFSGEVAPGEPFAHLVPNTAIAAALIEALGDRVAFFAPAEIVGAETIVGAGEIRLADGRTLRAPLVVAADGANSPLRDRAGIATIEHDYRQSGLVTTIGHAVPHDGVAWQHFLPDGPFASLPLPGNRSSLVWTMKPADAERLKALAPEALAGEIEAAMGSTLGAVTVEEAVQVYPLKLRLARSLMAPRLALVGDAAHVVHPIAGQGLNLGLKDVAVLAEVLVEAMRLGTDPGDPAVLAQYASWRWPDIAAMAAVTDGLNRLFSNDIYPLRAARDLGLGVVDRLPGLKSLVIGRAAGLGGRGPKLLDGVPL